MTIFKWFLVLCVFVAGAILGGVIRHNVGLVKDAYKNNAAK